MKLSRLLPPLLYSLCLLLGAWAGYAIELTTLHPVDTAPFLGVPSTQASATPSQGVSPRPLPNGQINLLVITTHSGKLETIMEIIYIQDYPSILLLPVYPSMSQSPRDEALAYNFSLTAENRLSPTFIRLLQEHNMAWSGYVVLDEIASATLGEAFVSPVNRPATALLSDSLCQYGQLASPRTDLSSLYQSLQGHIGSDLQLGSLLADWQTYLGQQPVQACEILSLPMTR